MRVSNKISLKSMIACLFLGRKYNLKSVKIIEKVKNEI